jgi:hypothetical protein
VSVHQDVQIALALKALLQDISVDAGYHFTVKPSSVSTDPQEILLVPDTELPFFLLVFPDLGGGRRFSPASQIRDQITGMVIARVDVVDPQTPDAKLRAAGDLQADLERALIGPNDDRGQLGGLVVDTRLGLAQPLYGLGADPIVIVRQPFTVTRHRTYGRPE